MKNIVYFLCTLFISFLLFACSVDSIEFPAEVPVKEKPVSKDPSLITPTKPTDPSKPDIDPKAACDFDLSKVAAGAIKTIDCLIDLGNKPVLLQPGVTLEFKGGDIVNGTLEFSSGKIDGRLLNSSLKIEGDAKLTSPEFEFIPSRWEIVEGKVTQPDAFKNHTIIQDILDTTVKMGAKTFSVDKIDAYFDSVKKQTPIIEMHSNIHFKMSANTHLRVFPVNKKWSSWMFRIRNNDNVKISGGFVHGERDEHGPIEPISGSLFWIMSGVDVLVENVHISNSSTTGLTINSYTFADNPEYNPSRNVVVRNCIFDANRANNLSITDGKDIIVENCKLYRAGIETSKSKGLAPRIGIVIEPVSGQKVDGVIIRNNSLKAGGGKSDILAALGNNIVITGNDATLPVGWTSASNIKVIDNPRLGGGIVAGFSNNGNLNSFALSKSINNIISGNTIIGAPKGIFATNDDIKIFNNKFIDCTIGILFKTLSDSEVYDNSFTSQKEGSFGFTVQKYLNNVSIRNNTFNIEKGRAFSMSTVNNDPEYSDFSFDISNNKFTSKNPATITRGSGVSIKENSFSNTGISFSDSKNITFESNTINSTSGSCINIGKTTNLQNIKIISNKLKNSNTDKLNGYGIRVLSSGSKASKENINSIIQDNIIEVFGSNYGISVNRIDGIDIKNNNGMVGNYEFIYLRGNNSSILNNKTLNGKEGIDIEGNNNKVAGNN